MVSAYTADESPHPHYVTSCLHGSLYCNQNFDEFQSILEHKDEKPLFRMSFDELLNDTISTESGQVTQNLPSSSSPVSHFPDSLNLNAAMRKKILDQVWSDFAVQEHVNQVHQSSLEEATIKDLMVRARAMNVGKQKPIGGDAQSLIAIDPMKMVS